MQAIPIPPFVSGFLGPPCMTSKNWTYDMYKIQNEDNQNTQHKIIVDSDLHVIVKQCQTNNIDVYRFSIPKFLPCME